MPHRLKTVIEPVVGVRWPKPAELWAYRELLWVFLARDIKVRYKQTVLGGLWALIQPFMTMVVFSVIFGKFAKVPSDGFPYPIFLYSALLPWTLFASTLTQSSSAILGAEMIIKKVYFPRLIIPTAAAGTPLIDYLVSSVLMVGMAIYYGVAPSWEIVFLPLLLFFISLCAQGMGLLMGGLAVSYRDFRHVIPFCHPNLDVCDPGDLRRQSVAGAWQFLLLFNPIAGLVEGSRHIWLNQPLDLFALLLSAGLSVLVWLVGLMVFQRQEAKMADRM